jgi:uncharacterized protein (DUF486 family)
MLSKFDKWLDMNAWSGLVAIAMMLPVLVVVIVSSVGLAASGLALMVRANDIIGDNIFNPLALSTVAVLLAGAGLFIIGLFSAYYFGRFTQRVLQFHLASR